MGFLDLFRKKDTYRAERREQHELENWNDIVYTRKNIDMDDIGQRREYIENCLQQMAEASRDMDSLQFEYRVVTSHLRDMEEGPEREELTGMMANYMKRSLYNWNRDAMDERKVDADLASYTDGIARVPEGFRFASVTNGHLPGSNASKKNGNKGRTI